MFLTLHLPGTGAWYKVPVTASWEDYVGLCRDCVRIRWGLYRDYVRIIHGLSSNYAKCY